MKLFLAIIIIGIILVVGYLMFGLGETTPTTFVNQNQFATTTTVQQDIQPVTTTATSTATTTATSTATTTIRTNATTTSMNTLKITDTTIGTGPEATNGKRITVHYTGRLQDGTVFDSSVTRGQPFTFTLGAGDVIEGWEKGFAGMKVGGKRTSVIPPEMAYGPRGAGRSVPPNATLTFDVELLGVE
jgi:peptidylprolyl isomerase